MLLKELRIYQLRNLSDISLAPAAGLNILSGPNACGKTAVLEAIYLLARGRSFRTHRIRELIQHQTERLRVTARVETGASRRIVPVGVERDRRQTQLRYDGSSVRNLSEHARRLPLVLITPDSHGLVSGRPAQRRRWLDWAMFHVEPEYLGCWQDCFHALRQRNTLLKHQAPAGQLASWEETLAHYSARLDAYREAFIRELEQEFRALVAALLGGDGSIVYLPGRDPDTDYRALLEASRGRDRERGFTQAGPHRSDLAFSHQAMDVRATLSRGQTKLYIAALMLACARVMAATGLRPLILVDDLPAELDADARQRFMATLAVTASQTFVTAIEPQIQPDEWAAVTRFHVEQGCRAEVLQ